MDSIQLIRSQSPLVLNLTNHVAMDLTANALLAVGASPIMANEIDELSELVKISSSIVINIGTLNKAFIESAQFTLAEAKKYQKTVVLDPVGAGATKLRTETAKLFLKEYAPTVVRGNASEITALFEEVSGKGVDTTLSSESVREKLKEYTKKLDTVFVVSGKTDYVFYQGKVTEVTGGDPMMTEVTAMGCTATSLIGAFLSVVPSAYQAAIEAMTLMARAGERAKQKCEGPGSFRVSFLDALYQL